VAVDIPMVHVTDIVLSEHEYAFSALNSTLQLSVTVSPSNASDPSITYSSSNPGVASVSSSGLVTAKRSGSAIITATSVDGGLTDTCSITVRETVTEIASIYSMSNNATISNYFYGVYQGIYGTASNGIYVANGDYGMLIYGGSLPSGAVEGQTVFRCKGTLSIFNGQYEIKNPTVEIATQEEADLYVKTPTIYSISGTETDASKLVSARKAVVSGVVKSVSGSVNSSADSTIKLTMSNGNETTVFVKKGFASSYYSGLAALKTVGNKVTLEGFTFISKTTFELAYPKLISYDLDWFAFDFLNETDAICGADTTYSHQSELSSIWTKLSGYYAGLSEEDKNTLKTMTSSESGDALAEALARYDYLVSKYNLSDYLDRGVESLGYVLPSLSEESPASVLPYILIIALASAAILGVIRFAKRRAS
ncbi:MAG: Ig-like domain-containing protein, partial [Bacilli bacterium]|nr:Ig-like domain-containing protein [Bacilli bacterium]